MQPRSAKAQTQDVAIFWKFKVALVHGLIARLRQFKFCAKSQVKIRLPVSIMLLAKCKPMAKARNGESLSMTKPKSTSLAPNKASVIVKITLHFAALRANEFAGKIFRAQRNVKTTKMPNSPEVARWASSTQVFPVALLPGSSCPWHKGQESPQPSPEWENRTHAPHKITISV